MTAYLDMATDDLRALEQELAAQYDVAKAKGIKLNMARGKPAADQLDLSEGLLTAVSAKDDCFSEGGADCRNYSTLDGLPEAPIDEVTFRRVRVSFDPDAQPSRPAMQNDAEERCRLGLYLNNVRRVVIDDVTVAGAAGGALHTPNCGEVVTTDLREVD